jgi:hypothetical protein
MFRPGQLCILPRTSLGYKQGHEIDVRGGNPKKTHLTHAHQEAAKVGIDGDKCRH